MISALGAVGHSCESFSDQHDQKKVRKLVIPGVGSFAFAMRTLKARGLLTRLSEYVESGGHVLGICLGMQLLAERGLENSDESGFGFVKGTVKPFRGNSSGEGLDTHVGFNSLKIINSGSPLLKGVDSSDDFYFTHSYFLPGDSNSHIAATANNGVELAAVVDRDNQVFGTQFHPEKSQRQGLKILKNYVSA